MLIVVGVIGTEDYITSHPFYVRGRGEIYWFKDSKKIETVGFGDDYNSSITYVNYNYALMNEKVYYMRKGKKQILDVVIVDTDILLFRICSLHEIAIMLENKRKIEGVLLCDTFFRISSFEKNRDMNFLLQHGTAVKVESNFKVFLVKNLMLEKPFYIVKLLAVNGNENYSVDLGSYSYEEQKTILNHLWNGVFTVGFYKADTLEEVGRFNMNYLDAISFYFKSGELDVIYFGAQDKNGVLTYCNHTVSYNNKSDAIYLSRQSFFRRDFLKDRRMKYGEYLDLLLFKDCSFCINNPLILIRFSCDTKPLIKIPCKFLVEN